MTLPAIPPLDLDCLLVERVESACGPLEAYVPAREPFRCADLDRAPSLVLIPGLGMDAMGFVRQLPLGAVADLHLLQMSNAALPGETELDCFARFVEEYIRARGLQDRPGGVFLGGCSMGGAVALKTATRSRVAFRGLILLGSFGHCRHLPAWQRLAAPLAGWLPLGLARRAVRMIVAKTGHFGRVSESEADWLVTTKAGHTRDYFARAVSALTRQNQLEAARALKLPTLVIHGADDRVLPHAAGREMAETIPGARLVTVKDSGHALFFTHHEEVNGAMAEFLAESRISKGL